MVRSIAARLAQRLSSGSPSCGPPRSRVTSEALAFYGRHFGALVLTCAIALLPATLLAAGAVTFSLAALGRGEVGEARSHNEQIREKQRDRKSTRLNSSHLVISYAVFCLKKKKKDDRTPL